MAGNAERWRECHRRPGWRASRGGSRAAEPASGPHLRPPARCQGGSLRRRPGRRAYRRGYMRLVRVSDMNDISETPPQDISLVAMAAFIRRHIGIIGSCLVLGGIAAGAASFLLTPRYRAEVVLSPVSSGTLSSELGGSLGGLAA